MIEYKALKLFRDLKEDRLCNIGDVVEFTPERAEEINSKLGKGFIEELRVEKAPSKPKKAK